MTIKKYVLMYGLALAVVAVAFVASLLAYLQSAQLEKKVREEFNYLTAL